MLIRATIILLFFVANTAAQSPPADLVIINANVRTMDKANPRAEAVAVADGRIVAVGTSQTIKSFAGKTAKVIDAKGKLLIPGFNDAHAHFTAIGNSFSSLDLSAAKTADEVIARFQHFVKYLPKGRWILGSKLDPAIELPLARVDAATPDNPVYIYHSDPKTAFANSSAMRLARVENTGSGNLKDISMQAVQRVVPANHTRDWPTIAETASNYAASLGVTSIQDTHSDDMLAVYRELAKQGRLKTRVYDCISIYNWANLAAVGTKAASGDAYLRNGCVKGFYDEDDDENGSLAKNIAGADSAGLQVLIHAIGQKANTVVLGAFERAAAANGPRDRRFRVEHAHDIRSADLIRFGKSKIIPSMQPILFFADGTGTTDDYRKLIDTAAPLAFGADAPMRGFNPIEGIYAAVNAGGKRSITVEEAVYAYTLGAAYAEFQEKEKGSIEIGKLADFVMLSDDISSVEKTRLRDVFVVLTVVNGRIVYENTK